MGFGSSASIFLDSVDGTIWNALYKRFFEEDRDSYMFPTFEEGLDNLMEMSRAAYYNIMESVFAIDEVKCEVLMPWKTDYPSLLGMAVPKKSPYFEMLRYQLLKQIENGNWRVN